MHLPFLKLAISAIAVLTALPAVAAPTCEYPKEAIEIGGRIPPKHIALTFDDGPDPATTPRILDVLKKYRIKATFFLVGENIAGNEAIVRRELREGHHIGNHTWTHPHLPLIHRRAVEDELFKTTRLLERFRDSGPRMARFPFGESTCYAEAATRAMRSEIVGWDVDSCDWSYEEGLDKSDCVPRELRSKFRANYIGWIDHQLAETKGGVVLMHDAQKYEADHFEQELKHLMAQGYKFVDLKTMLSARGRLRATLDTSRRAPHAPQRSSSF